MNLVLSRETDAPERDAAAPAADQSPARRSFPALCMCPTLKVKTPPERLAHFGDETLFLVPSSFGSSLDPAGSPHCSHSAWCKTSPSLPASLLTWRNVHSLDIVHIFDKFPLPLLLLPKVSGPEVHLNPWNRIRMHPKESHQPRELVRCGDRAGDLLVDHVKAEFESHVVQMEMRLNLRSSLDFEINPKINHQ